MPVGSVVNVCRADDLSSCSSRHLILFFNETTSSSGTGSTALEAHVEGAVEVGVMPHPLMVETAEAALAPGRESSGCEWSGSYTHASFFLDREQLLHGDPLLQRVFRFLQATQALFALVSTQLDHSQSVDPLGSRLALLVCACVVRVQSLRSCSLAIALYDVRSFPLLLIKMTVRWKALCSVGGVGSYLGTIYRRQTTLGSKFQIVDCRKPVWERGLRRMEIQIRCQAVKERHGFISDDRLPPNSPAIAEILLDPTRSDF